MRVLLRLRFDGTEYRGWQFQPGLPTVQQEVETALKNLCGRQITVYAAGRTDSGVHCLDMPVHLDVDPREFPMISGGLNSFLPPSVRCCFAGETGDAFHARFDAVSRRYRYRIGREQNPLSRLYEYQPGNPILNTSRMKLAADLSLGESSWKGFSKEGSENSCWDIKVLDAGVEEDDLGWNLTIMANRFLRGAVRIWSGTLFRIGTGRIPPESVTVILRTEDRRMAGPSLPACGLTLTEVGYPDGI